jgi:hypothetical protein
MSQPDLRRRADKKDPKKSCEITAPFVQDVILPPGY